MIILRLISRLIRQLKVEEPLLEVGSCDTDLDRVAKGIALTGIDPYERHGLVVVLVEVIAEVTDRHQSLAAILLDLHKDPEVLDTTDHTLKLLTQSLLHILDLLVLD